MPDPAVTTNSDASASTTPVVTTATAVPQPTGDLAKDISSLLADLQFDGAGQPQTSNLAHDPEITAAEMAWDKVADKFKSTDTTSSENGETVTDPSTASSEAQAAAEGTGVEPTSGDQPQSVSADGDQSQSQPQSSPTLDADDLDDPATPTVIDITKPRGQRIYAAYKAMTQLAAPPEAGGIGHVPTPDQVGSYFKSHLEIQRLLNDYHDPNPEIFISGLAQTDPAALDRLAVALPQHIQRTNPQAYEQLAVPVLENAIGALIDHARVATDQVSKDHWFNVANSLKFYLSDGKSQLDKSILDQPVDPVSDIRSDYERLKAVESQRHAQDVRSATTEFTQTLGKDTHTAVMSSIERTLSNVKPQLSAKVYSDLVTSVFNEVKNGVITNRFAQSAINSAKRNATTTGAVLNRAHWDAHVKNITGTYMQFAQPIIQQAARSRMAEYTRTAVAQSQSQQQTVQQPRPATQQTPIRRGAPAGTSPRSPGPSSLTQRPTSASPQGGNKTAMNHQTNAERALEDIFQLLQ
jgi:hypothetical protein